VDRIDPALNPGSFRLGDIAFGDTVIEVPPDQVFFQKRVDLSAEPGLAGLSLDITAGLRADVGEAFWTLKTIDNASGLVPSDARLGFLLPTDSSGQGLGWVEFTVKPKPAAGSGIIILNDAAITFDANEPFTTNETQHTLDADAPRSRVEPLPANVDDPAIPLRWSLEGPEDLSGIAGFAIHVSIDGGSFTPYIALTGETSGTYPGEPGRSYAFYSLAIDRAGNVEEPPPAPDAATAVQGGAARFRRGDANADGRANITDAIFTLSYQFLGGRAPPCIDAADTNDDGFLNITDPIFLLNALFLGQTLPPSPGIDSCGLDPTADDLGPCDPATSGCG
jgi:hypothetical protein